MTGGVSEMADVADLRPRPASPPSDPGSEPPNFAVRDQSFIDYVERLKSLHNFLYQAAIPMSSPDVTSLQMGILHSIYFKSDGRMPTVDEWNQVERQTQEIFLLLTPALRRKFLISKTPITLIRLPLYLLGLAVIAVVVPVTAFNFAWQNILDLVFYLIWTACLGSLGALSSIGMNALSIQDDVTFDISNSGLTALRVILGALFAVVLDLPLGYNAFFNFCNTIAFPVAGSTVIANPSSSAIEQIVLLLAPFVLGFSTSTVIMILNQLVDAVQSLFGGKGKQEAQDTALLAKPPVVVAIPDPSQAPKVA
jgi:hypothetical protein